MKIKLIKKLLVNTTYHFFHNSNTLRFHDRSGKSIEISTADYYGAIKAISALH